MLDSLRLFAKSWPGKILGGVLLVGTAGFGINNVIMDLGSNTVARVGGEEISTREFLRAYQGQMNQVAQQIGSVPTASDAMALGIPTMVLQGLAQDAALDQMAKNFGLGVSEDKLSQMLRQDPAFAGTLGQFDPATFPQVLQASGITEAEYFEMQSNVARRQQLSLALFGDMVLPKAATDLVNRYIGDRRTVDYIVIGETSVETPAAPTEEDLAAYLGEHQAEFRTVETRNVAMLALSPQVLAEAKTISDDAVNAEYERTKANLVRPERRTIQQVVLNEEQAAAFEAGLSAGTDFETLMTDNGLTATDLGNLARNQVTDAALADAAFGLAEGGFAVIDGVAGKRAIHVSAIDLGGEPTLEEAREEIRQNLALTEARAEYGDVLDQIEELRAAFQPLSEIASRLNLPLHEAAVTAGGAELAVVPAITEADRPAVSQAIFKATEDQQITPSVALAGNSTLWFDLESIEPARDQTLDEVRDQVVAAWTAEKTDEAITTETEAVLARLDAGEALADIAASLNLFPQISQPFGRNGEAETSIDRIVASAAFAGGPDHRGSAVNAAGEHIVFQVTNVLEADDVLDEQARTALSNDARVGVYGDFVTAVAQEAQMTINQQVLTQALALDTAQ